MSRHARIHELTHEIAAVLHARDAAALPDSAMVGDLYVLPLWAWGPSRRSVGRKDINRADRSKLDMPTRLLWDVPTVGLVDDLPADGAAFETCGSGYEESGSIDVASIPKTVLLPDADLPTSVTWGEPIAPLVVRADSFAGRRLLESLEHAGGTGYWALMQRIEEQAKHFLEKTVTSLTISTSTGEDGPLVMNEQERTELVSTFTLGTEGATASPAQRLIERCVAPHAFARVDPQMMMTASVRRDIREAAHLHLGDTRIGDRIRKVAADLGIASTDDGSIDKIITEFNQRHDPQRVGAHRVRKAMSVHAGIRFVPLTTEVEDNRPGSRSLLEAVS